MQERLRASLRWQMAEGGGAEFLAFGIMAEGGGAEFLALGIAEKKGAKEL